MRTQLLQKLRALPLAQRQLRESVLLESSALQTLFPAGIPRGTLSDWLSEQPGSGAETLLLKLAAELRGVLIVVDSQHSFYPPAASALGVDLSDTIVVRTRNASMSLWAVEQSLRCRGVSVVLARMQQIDGRAFRRLQLAAEHGGGIGMLLRPANQRGSPSWSQARFLVRSRPSQRLGRRLQIELLHLSGGDLVDMELDDATGTLHLVSQVADPATLRRAVGA